MRRQKVKWPNLFYQKLLFCFLFFLFTFFSTEAYSKINDTTFGLFLGTGPNFSFPGPIRGRYKELEIGTYGAALGATKIFPIDNLYFELGAGLAGVGKLDVGVIGAMGYEIPLFWVIGLRGELFSYVGTTGYTYSAATVGLSVGF